MPAVPTSRKIPHVHVTALPLVPWQYWSAPRQKLSPPSAFRHIAFAMIQSSAVTLTVRNIRLARPGYINELANLIDYYRIRTDNLE